MENPPASSAVTPAPPPKTSRFSFKKLVWPLITLLLVIGLVVAVLLWKPWQARVNASDRTISVTGTATIKAEPDEFVFYPTYTITATDKQTALNTMTDKSNAITAKLKSLGVASDKIKVDSSSYDSVYPLDGQATSGTAYLSITVTIDDKTLAQKVQDYLITTSPDGDVTPQSSFSDAKEKSLESQARDQAETDARSKADQSAKNLGFKVKAVKTVEDGSFEDDINPCGPSGLCSGANSATDLQSSSTPQLQLQPGQNDLPYSVKVTFYIQ